MMEIRAFKGLLVSKDYLALLLIKVILVIQGCRGFKVCKDIQEIKASKGFSVVKVGRASKGLVSKGHRATKDTQEIRAFKGFSVVKVGRATKDTQEIRV